jgi:hypothetical protein
MAIAEPDIGTGATIAFGSSAYEANLMSLEVSEISRAQVKTSHMGTSGGAQTTGYHTYIPGRLVEPPKMTVEFELNTNALAPITADLETITITFPDASTFSGSGFVSTVGFSVPMEDLMTMTVEVQGSGAWAIA